MLGLDNPTWTQAGNATLINSGDQINEAELLFEKIDDNIIQDQIQKLEATKKANEIANKTITPAKNEIAFDDFMKMDMRVGTIKSAEKIKKSKKLLKLTIDTGLDERIVVSGIAEFL